MKNLMLKNIILGIALVATAACASTGETTLSNEGQYEDKDMVYVDNPSLPLAQYLQKIPGVNVLGSGNSATVYVRGIHSFMGTSQPLFVIDGVRVGNNFSTVANMVNTNNIAHIKVLKGVDAAIYGVQGGNGVIEITTKQ